MTQKLNELIGFQVVDGNGEYPSDDTPFYSFEVLTLEHALRIQATDPKRWRLLPIYDGDVEEPTLIGNDHYDGLSCPECGSEDGMAPAHPDDFSSGGLEGHLRVVCADCGFQTTEHYLVYATSTDE